MKITVVVLIFVFTVSCTYSQKKHHATVSKERAAKTLREQFPGAVILSEELEKENGKLIWSFDVKQDSSMREIWVDAHSGKVIKTEEESTTAENDEKISDRAEQAALKKVPGEITNKEVSEKNGHRIYSFDIKTKQGKTVEVEVDGASDKILRIETEDEDKDNDEDD